MVVSTSRVVSVEDLTVVEVACGWCGGSRVSAGPKAPRNSFITDFIRAVFLSGALHAGLRKPGCFFFLKIFILFIFLGSLRGRGGSRFSQAFPRGAGFSTGAQGG